MAEKKPLNSFASKRKVSHDLKKKKEQKRSSQLQQWAKGTVSELPASNK